MSANKIENFKMMAMALTLLAIVPKIENEVRPIIPTNQPPLCVFQFALVNYACGRLPFTRGALPAPLEPPLAPDNDGGGNDEGTKTTTTTMGMGTVRDTYVSINVVRLHRKKIVVYRLGKWTTNVFVNLFIYHNFLTFASLHTHDW